MRHQRYACNSHLSRIKVADAKSVGQRVDQAVDKERRRLSALSASIAHQDGQRCAGIYKPDSAPNAPRAGRRNRPSATELKRRHRYSGGRGHFYFGLTLAAQEATSLSERVVCVAAASRKGFTATTPWANSSTPKMSA